MPFNADLFTTIATNVVTAAVAYFGTIKGSKLQIKSQQVTTQQQIDSDRQTAMLQLQNEQQNLDDAISKQNEFTRKAIKNFISHEIKSNLTELIKSGDTLKMITRNDFPFHYTVNPSFKYDEYNNLKYELIKFESEEAEEIIGIYDMFQIIDRKRNFHDFNQFEYDRFKKYFDVCNSKYGKFSRG
ncbi:hypothetical protein [Priestia megaterium]|uniref:hypothetical protein n=1 Tax=Priestia megaterium TaxID=1404 RepID=UPI000BFBDF0C|nr:hypothetical protein [Priestia megaterium]PGT75532.1 hypothetical protein COD15_07255 [Priestia megaterium]